MPGQLPFQEVRVRGSHTCHAIGKWALRRSIIVKDAGRLIPLHILRIVRCVIETRVQTRLTSFRSASMRCQTPKAEQMDGYGEVPARSRFLSSIGILFSRSMPLTPAPRLQLQPNRLTGEIPPAERTARVQRVCRYRNVWLSKLHFSS